MMVEALIALALITIFFASGTYLYRAYDRKLHTFNEATGKAFRTASAGCGSGFGSYSIETLIKTPPPDPLSPTPDTSFLGGTIDTTNEVVTADVQKPTVLGGGVLNIGSSGRVACNEPPMTKAQALGALGVVDWSVNGVIGAAGF
jgi:hypothetical protein